MSDYSKVNLREVDNSSQTDGVQARFARKYLDSRDLGVTLLVYPPNFKAESAHSHKVQEEAYVVIKGSGSILVDKEEIQLKEWDVIRVKPEAVRAFSSGDDGLEIIAVGGPKPEEGDGVRATPEWPKTS
jgi:mannose-6-phosphate isomerase-like protein (cupin superfamily)